MKIEQIQEGLERLLDGSDLDTVVDQLAQICRLKADHVQSNWQDEPLAKEWLKAANAIEKIKLPEGL